MSLTKSFIKGKKIIKKKNPIFGMIHFLNLKSDN